MPDYGLVSRAINQLSDRIERTGQQQRAHEASMADLGLQGARIDLQGQQIRGQQQLAQAQAERDKFMNEVVTGRQAIMTHPGLNDQQKQAFVQRVPKEILDGMAFKRGEWANGLRKAQMEQQKMMSDDKFRSEQLGLMRARNKIALARSASERDTRSKAQKEVEFIQQTFNLSPQEAYAKYQEDQSLPERIRLYVNDLKALKQDWSYVDASPEEQEKRVDRLRSDYKIDKVTGKTTKETQQLSLPNNIKKASEAMSYLKEQGLTDEQATSWLRDYMSK